MVLFIPVLCPEGNKALVGLYVGLLHREVCGASVVESWNTLGWGDL